MSEPVLTIRLLDDRSEITISRNGNVSDSQWLQVRGFWPGLRDGGNVIRIRVEVFMADRLAFVRRLRQLGLGADADGDVLRLAQESNASRLRLREALDNPRRLTGAEVEELLAASRFTIAGQLRPFQIEDLQKLLALEHGANFSVPGAGKTAVTLAVYEAERARARVRRLLVIAPLSAFGSWEDEVATWLTDAPAVVRYSGGHIPSTAEIVIVNYHRLHNSYDELVGWVGAEPTMVVLDEAHRMKKGWLGEHGRACLSLAYRAKRRDILTGTPAPQGPRDLIALMDFLWPNQALQILPPAAMAPNPAADAMPEVAKAIGPLFVRTNKRKLDLPEYKIEPVEVPLEPLHQEIYDALRTQTASDVATMTRRDRLDFARMSRITMYMLEAATNPKLLTAGSLEGADPDVFRHPPLEVPPGSRLAELLEQYNLYETPRKFTELAKRVKANADAGRKTLVWSNFVRNLRLLEPQLARYQPALIHGSVPAYSPNPNDRTRDTEIKRFRHDDNCMVLLANPAAMSEGISLHRECHDAIYLDRTFNAGQYLQSIDRIHRLGLAADQETRITFLLSADTIDEVVDRRVAMKAERLGAMLGDPDLATVALPNEEEYGAVMDEPEDFEALFAHLRGDDGS